MITKITITIIIIVYSKHQNKIHKNIIYYTVQYRCLEIIIVVNIILEWFSLQE